MDQHPGCRWTSDEELALLILEHELMRYACRPRLSPLRFSVQSGHSGIGEFSNCEAVELRLSLGTSNDAKEDPRILKAVHAKRIDTPSPTQHPISSCAFFQRDPAALELVTRIRTN
eukprot:gnl/TRDRNA2_/TRDRNA2_141458_c1_seq1.p1 gnl/TRDRNA2_/TRDRNA2_141458_c1~~gnl/TRDRNA2_/TRDRNA2_141458_c1_seq1.p1  ORF type:complete len:116 (+),score=6.16 gnl/TRDRNA2_/TRDRNA2_141458_c1_seq1:188-535(+)